MQSYGFGTDFTYRKDRATGKMRKTKQNNKNELSTVCHVRDMVSKLSSQ